jgi:hypothetical protein
VSTPNGSSAEAVAKRCSCGQPLHYTSEIIETAMALQVARLGPTVKVTVAADTGERTWEVPRHYIALHGLEAPELPRLADKLGFREVTGR